MSSTLNKQRERSTRCAEKSKARIEYHGEKDFWAFYLANKAQIDHIIEVQSQKFAWYIEPQEMIQEVLIRLHDSNVLGKYNPKKSSVSTHLYGHIFGYINHVARAYSRQWKPCSMVESGVRLQSNVSNRVFFKDFNGLDDEHFLGNTTQEWSSKLSCRTEEEELDANFMKEDLVRGLSSRSQEILEYWLQGYDCSSIAKKIGCAPSSVSGKMDIIQSRLRKLLG